MRTKKYPASGNLLNVEQYLEITYRSNGLELVDRWTVHGELSLHGDRPAGPQPEATSAAAWTVGRGCAAAFKATADLRREDFRRLQPGRGRWHRGDRYYA